MKEFLKVYNEGNFYSVGWSSLRMITFGLNWKSPLVSATIKKVKLYISSLEIHFQEDSHVFYSSWNRAIVKELKSKRDNISTDG